MFMRRIKKRNKESSFSNRQGLLLALSIGAFVALMFLMVYYVYVLPMEKSVE